jgi:polyisoprenoid-binding protein YceI
MRVFTGAPALAMTLGLGLAAMSDTAIARDWRMNPDESSLTFTFRQMGSPIEGRFTDFSADITFAPDDLANASVRAEIAVDSVDTGNSERDAGIVGADWFDTATYPIATFESTSFATAGDDSYTVTGDLTIRDVTETIELPMSISVDGDSASASGTIELDRRTFGVGRGDWASDSAVGYDVVLVIEVVAEAAD